MSNNYVGLVLNQRYEIIKVLGAGGMGVVLQAYDKFLDRHVAVKVIQPEFNWSQTAIDAFIREARIIARLEHPNILNIYDLGIHPLKNGNLVYLVMRLASGGTLADRLEKGPLPLNEIQQILNAVCEGLDYAHKQNVIHLDLKPLNILFDNHGNPMVADFGLAKMLQNATQVKADTRVGTFAYMPPEQLFGAKAGPFSDVYALGITFYELLTGALPDREWNGVVRFAKGLPSNTLSIIERATEANPEQRFQSVGEFQRTLSNLDGYSNRNRVRNEAKQILGLRLIQSFETESSTGFEVSKEGQIIVYQSENLNDDYRIEYIPVCYIWGFESDKMLHSLNYPPSLGRITNIKVSPNGRLIGFTTEGESKVQIWDSQTGRKKFEFPTFKGLFDLGDYLLLTGQQDSSFTVRNLDTGLTETIHPNGARPNLCLLNSNADSVLISNDQHCRVFSTKTWNEVFDQTIHARTSVRFSATSRFVITGSRISRYYDYDIYDLTNKNIFKSNYDKRVYLDSLDKLFFFVDKIGIKCTDTNEPSYFKWVVNAEIDLEKVLCCALDDRVLFVQGKLAHCYEIQTGKLLFSMPMENCIGLYSLKNERLFASLSCTRMHTRWRGDTIPDGEIWITLWDANDGKCLTENLIFETISDYYSNRFYVTEVFSTSDSIVLLATIEQFIPTEDNYEWEGCLHKAYCFKVN